MQYDKSLLISMNLKNIKESIKIIFFLIILLFIMHSNRSFYNLYILAKFNIDERLTKSYGYCNNASYGFINEIYNEYSIKENILGKAILKSVKADQMIIKLVQDELINILDVVYTVNIILNI